MQFNRLRLTGFKSFVDPTDLIIEPGMTGIVGPNGCGKSNLVEALRWVMGETSAKRMRGGEMDDVIFGGTSERPARNIAEVSLHLDNSDRAAPAAFNDSDELEISRRIEREQGSRYLINGRDVRARDVQLLFADAATGANSAAMVSQGQVAEVINAKPQQRRGILEEAAGIKGIHSRRHEAELRLRAAETNLERVDDVVQTLESQLQGLKRQARQATRYRNISGHIRSAEAILLHLKWTAASEILEEAEARLTEAERAVTDRTGRAAAAATAQTDTAEALPGLRDTEAAAGAVLHRFAVERDNLEAEENRANETLSGLRARLEQIADDTGREEGLAADAKGSLAGLADEESTLHAARDGEDEATAKAQARAAEISGEVSERDAQVQALTEAAASAETRRFELGKQTQDLRERQGRLQERLRDTKAELAELTAALPEHEEHVSEGDVAAARVAAEEARLELRRAEAERQHKSRAEDAARDALTPLEAHAARLEAEADGLAELLKVNEDDLWPPLVDAVTVEPGYERALGAALGDDLSVSSDTGAPVHWRTIAPYSNPAALPGEARPLSSVVQAPAALARRLSQVGLVGDTEGAALSGDLAQGQRLVTKDGALWRWDGFTAAADAATPAATRLSQRNRLKDLRAQAADLEGEVGAARRALEDARERNAAAAKAEAEAREAGRAVDERLGTLREAAAGAAQEAAERTSRLTVLGEGEAQFTQDLEEIEVRQRELEEARSALDAGEDPKQQIGAARRALDDLRARLTGAEAERERLVQEARQRGQRLAAIASERATWRQRVEAADAQIEALARRRAEVEAEITAVESLPEGIAERRGALGGRIETAEIQRREAAAALAEAEDRLAVHDRALKAAQEELAEVRERRVRLESALEAANQSLKDVAALIAERLECPPREALAKSDYKEGKELPGADLLETRLDRLRGERDRMGPVNLRAELEADEIREQIDTLQAERDDLDAAIARLRQGISGLNREGRERLLASFDTVNAHFRELFVRLFGGGRAHLALTEADDPLEAGLEIMASPPGKRLQTMSLLSGGEQALTAICLLFAVFLTNPAPICVLDEVDAPLDESNVERFCNLVQHLSRDSDTRFLIITHNAITMARMDRLYGVTMAERGVSQLVSVDLSLAERLREAG